MGIVYVAAAFLVVPAILLLFHRLSRTPPLRPEPDRAAAPDHVTMSGVAPDHVTMTGAALDHVTMSGGPSVAEEAESWLRSQL